MPQFPPREIDAPKTPSGAEVPLPGPLDEAQDLIDHGATFGVGLALPAIPLVPSLGFSLGIQPPTLPFSLCGFKLPLTLPGFSFAYSFPGFSIPLPSFTFALGISCDGILNGHPLQFAADVPWGGGRVGTMDRDEDLPEDD